MKLTTPLSLLVATTFVVAQTSPTLYQDFTGLYSYLTSSVDDATSKVKAANATDTQVLKSLVAKRNHLMSVQLDFYHLYINAVHEDEETITNSTEAKEIAMNFIKYSARVRVYIGTQLQRADDLLSLGKPFAGVAEAKTTLQGLETGYDTFYQDTGKRLDSMAKYIEAPASLTDQIFAYAIEQYNDIQNQCQSCDKLDL